MKLIGVSFDIFIYTYYYKYLVSSLLLYCFYYLVPLEDYVISHEWAQGTNVLGLVMFSVVMGAVIGKMKEKGKPLQDVFSTLSEAMMIITHWVIFFSPLGIFFLIAEKMLEIQSFTDVFIQLGWYFLTVMLGLLLHGLGKYKTLHMFYLIL